MIRLDPLIEGYLDYKKDVNKIAPGTLRDIRSSLNRVMRQLQPVRPDVPLWQLSFEDYLRYVELERQTRRLAARPSSVALSAIGRSSE